MSDVYYNPEDFGLTLVAEMNLSEPCYSFDLLAAWKNAAGEYFIGTDSGCSCPTPFENYNGLADLTGPLTYEEVVLEAAALVDTSYEKGFALGEFPRFVAGLKDN